MKMKVMRSNEMLWERNTYGNDPIGLLFQVSTYPFSNVLFRIVAIAVSRSFSADECADFIDTRKCVCCKDNYKHSNANSNNMLNSRNFIQKFPTHRFSWHTKTNEGKQLPTHAIPICHFTECADVKVATTFIWFIVIYLFCKAICMQTSNSVETRYKPLIESSSSVPHENIQKIGTKTMRFKV